MIVLLELDDGRLRRGIGPETDVLHGEEVELYGAWSPHRGSGKVFEFETIRARAPTNTNQQIEFVAKALDISLVDARRIQSHFGDSTFAVLDATPHRLTELPAFDETRAEHCGGRWQEFRAAHKGDMLLQGLRLTKEDRQRLADAMHMAPTRMVETIQQDPFLIYLHLSHISFFDIQDLADQLNVPKGSPSRVEGAVLAALRKAARNGHTYLPAGDLPWWAARMIKGKADDLDFQGAVDRLLARGMLATANSRVYLEEHRTAELDALAELTELETHTATFAIPSNLDRICKALASRFPAADIPRASVDVAAQAMRQKVSLVDGGPREVSMRAARAIALLAGVYKVKVLMLTATECSADRLRARFDDVGVSCTSVGRHLRLSPAGTITAPIVHRDSAPQLVVVVDADSLDIHAFSGILKGTPKDACLVFVGDSDMSPNMGAGRPYHDLVAMKRLPIIEAKAGTGSSPSAVTAELLRDAIPVEAVVDSVARPVTLLRAIADDMIPRLEKVVRTSIERFELDGARDVMVLTPTMKMRTPRERSVIAAVRSIANPGADLKSVAGKLMEVGDPLVVSHVIEDPYLSPGARLFVDEVHSSNSISAVCGNEHLVLEGAALQKVSIGYLTGTYRSLSQSADIVILLLPEGAKDVLLHRSLLYSVAAIARRHLFILGAPASLRGMLKRDAPRVYSGFAELLDETMHGTD